MSTAGFERRRLLANQRQREHQRKRAAWAAAFRPLPAAVCRCENPLIQRHSLDGDPPSCIRCGRWAEAA